MTFDFAIIYSTVVAAVPTLTAIISLIIMVVKALKNNVTIKEAIDKKMESLMAEVKENTAVKEQYEKTQAQVMVVIDENYKLRKEIAELLTEVTRIEHKVEEMENEQRNTQV